MTHRTLTTALGAIVLASLLAGCSGGSDAVATPTADAPTPTPTATPTPTSTPEPAAAEAPTCDTMVSPGTVQALTEAGWTFEEKEFVIGDVALNDGVLCFWADYTVASDHGQLYGWSAITADQAADAQSSLLASGWTREDGADGIYITENPDFSMGTDDAGYGMTYLFGDGWVKFADTRQSLLLIDWQG